MSEVEAWRHLPAWDYRPVVAMHLAVDYTGGAAGGPADPEDDWAILELGADVPWDDPVETMWLSDATDSQLGDIDVVHNFGYPGSIVDSGGACVVNEFQSDMYSNQEDQPIAGITPLLLRLKIDSTHGQSGSPWFDCPFVGDRSCSGSELGVVFGVNAGHLNTDLLERQLGPKVPGHRAEMLQYAMDP